MITSDEAAVQLAEHVAREQLIDVIVEAARKPCPRIVPSLHGGFAYQQRDGSSTYGKRHQSEQDARNAWLLIQVGNAMEFREQLRGMSDAQLESQRAYWCKDPPVG